MTSGHGAPGAGAAAEATGLGPSSRARVNPLAKAVFALLVAACFGAFFLTQGLKHTPTAVQRFERTPTFAPRSTVPERREERVSFKLATADSVTVSIVDSDLNVVAVLVRDHPLPRYKQFSLRWNGRRGSPRGFRTLVSENGHRSLLPLIAGPFAPPGEYRVRVELKRQAREVLSPWSFTLKGGTG